MATDDNDDDDEADPHTHNTRQPIYHPPTNPPTQSSTLATLPVAAVGGSGGKGPAGRPLRYRRGGLHSPWALPVRSVKHHPIWEDAELSHIFEANKK
jgi:hypothetical protein